MARKSIRNSPRQVHDEAVNKRAAQPHQPNSYLYPCPSLSTSLAYTLLPINAGNPWPTPLRTRPQLKALTLPAKCHPKGFWTRWPRVAHGWMGGGGGVCSTGVTQGCCALNLHRAAAAVAARMQPTREKAVQSRPRQMQSWHKRRTRGEACEHKQHSGNTLPTIRCTVGRISSADVYN